MSKIYAEQAGETLATSLDKLKWYRYKKIIQNFMGKSSTQFFRVAILFLSLFLTQSWTFGNASNGSDIALNIILFVILSFFLLEMGLLWIAQESYLFSFFFWMDLIGTLTVVLDLTYVSLAVADRSSSNNERNISLLRIARLAKIAARYARVFQFMKLLKFLIREEDEEESVNEKKNISSVKRLSNKLSTALSERVAALVLISVILVPFIAYKSKDRGAVAYMSTLRYMARTPDVNATSLTHVANKIHHFYAGKDMRIIDVKVASPYILHPVYLVYPTRDVIRSENKMKLDYSFASGSATYDVYCNIDMTITAQQDAMFQILLITFAIVVLSVFTASFRMVVEELVVAPLDKLIGGLRDSASILLKTAKDISADQGSDDDEMDQGGDVEVNDVEVMVRKLLKISQHIRGGEAKMNLEESVAQVAQEGDGAVARWLSAEYISNQKNASDTITKIERSHTMRMFNADADEETVSFMADAMSERDQISRSCGLDGVDLDSWTFDPNKFNVNELQIIVLHLFAKLGFLSAFEVPLPIMKDFLLELSSKYLDNVYHNFKHGCDVCQCTYRLIYIPKLDGIFTKIEQFSLLIAALSHDVGHPGVNNAFLVKIRDPVALQHNDKSPLENMHCVTLYEILRRPSSNIFASFSEKQWRDSRKIILTAILGTDMVNHFDQISKSALFLEEHGAETIAFCSDQAVGIPCLEEEKNRLFIMEILLHSADISNPFKPFDLYDKWSRLITEEFCQQGDREKLAGMDISPMMDRTAIVLSTMQMGFVEFVVSPLVNAVVKIFPPLQEIGLTMTNNFVMWAQTRKTEIVNENENKDVVAEELKKLDDRTAKWNAKQAFLLPTAVTEEVAKPKLRNSSIQSAFHKRFSIAPKSSN